MEKVKYIGKCLLIENEEAGKRDKILVIGDIHIGAFGKIGGVDISKRMYDEMISDFEEIFERIEKVEKVVILGDLKHEFSGLTLEERYGLVNLFDYLDKKCKKIEIIKGNHDNYLLEIVNKRKYIIREYLLLEKYCFLHGDKDFSEIYKKKIKFWIMGHLHPAVSLRDGVKVEKYKCFLEGKYRDKKIIILPSFSGIGEGIDVVNNQSNLAWKFNLMNFRVKIMGENLEVLDFGKVGDLK